MEISVYIGRVFLLGENKTCQKALIFNQGFSFCKIISLFVANSVASLSF